MDVEREIAKADKRIRRYIEGWAHNACARIEDMHTVPTGICHCGSEVDSHGQSDNHGPVELRWDKAWGDLYEAVRTEDAPVDEPLASL